MYTIPVVSRATEGTNAFGARKQAKSERQGNTTHRPFNCTLRSTILLDDGVPDQLDGNDGKQGQNGAVKRAF
jgi:hypothetical protein